MASFEEILNKPASAIEPPKPYPVGTYLCLIQGPGENKTVGKENTPCIDFNASILQPQSDVDQAVLAEMGGVAGKQIRIRQFVTDDSVWRLKKFLVEDLGIDEQGKSMKELLAEAPGKQVMVAIRHRASQDGTQIFSEVASTAKV